VTNKDLDGVEEVTAAHETLHAIWERMSSDEKTRVGALLEVAYKKINDPKLNERMAYYDRTEPGERDNELHSILGTEYKDLGSDLEAHYANYFTDRAKVVDLHDAYQSKFDALKTKSDALASELAHLKTSIDTQSTQYNNEVAAINADAQKLKQSYDSVDRTNQNEIDAYNAQRQQLLDRIAALNVLKIKIINETNTYNQKVVEYNALVVSTNELNKSLDSTLSPTPSL
jgi:chromosome segregation ATPase